jgi:hypothetical protein
LSTAEIKEKLIEKVLITNNEILLREAMLLLDAEISGDEIYFLNNEEKRQLTLV